MSEVHSDVRNNSHCLICNSRVGVSTRNSIPIFSKQPQTVSERSVNTIIAGIVGQEISESNVHSLIVCKKCFKLFSEYDELETRLLEIKADVASNYKKTINKYKSDDILKVEIKIENTNDENSHDEDISSQKSEHGEIRQTTQKKFLSIPSSDEEPEKRRKKLDLVETNLERLNRGDATKVEVVTIGNSEIIVHGDDVPEISIPETNDDADDSQDFDPFVQDDDEPVDAGAIDQSDDSDYQSPMVLEIIRNGNHDKGSDDNTTALLEAAAMAEQTLEDGSVIMDVKIEPLTYDVNTKEVKKGKKRAPKTKSEEYPYPILSRNDSEYTCLVCEGDDKFVGDGKAIMLHVKHTHDLRVYVCDVCGVDFRKRTDLSAHLDDHVATEEGDFQCEVCNRIFSNLRLFRIHKRMHYPQTKLWTCDTCGKRYSSKNLLDEHINTHTGSRPHVCGVCNKDFASKYTYRAHVKTHEVGSDLLKIRPRPFNCKHCDKTFLSQQNLTQHERTHTGAKDFICHLCGKAFGSPHNLEVHSIVHTGYKPFICRTCGKAFARKAEIRDHERTHTGERPYQCEFCGATFSQRSNLQSHKRATHYDDKRYKCRECNKGFKRRRLLDYHMKAVHTGERPYKCNVCDATFVYPEHFKKHRRIHTGEKPFTCEVCGKAFNSRDNRNAHRFVHSDKKPYECLMCGMGFMRKPLLYAHMEAQNHLNDTIVVNQPRLTTDDDQVMTFNLDGDMEIIQEEDQDMEVSEDTKLYITDLKDHVIIQNSEEGTLIVPENSEIDQEDMEQLIIDGQVHYATEDVDEDHIQSEVHEISHEQLIKGHILNANGELDDQPPSSGSYQIVQVTLNSGDDQDTWVNLVSDS